MADIGGGLYPVIRIDPKVAFGKPNAQQGQAHSPVGARFARDGIPALILLPRVARIVGKPRSYRSGGHEKAPGRVARGLLYRKGNQAASIFARFCSTFCR